MRRAARACGAAAALVALDPCAAFICSSGRPVTKSSECKLTCTTIRAGMRRPWSATVAIRSSATDAAEGTDDIVSSATDAAEGTADDIDLTDDEDVASIRLRLLRQSPGNDGSDPLENVVLEEDSEQSPRNDGSDPLENVVLEEDSKQMAQLAEKLRDTMMLRAQESGENTLSSFLDDELNRGEEELRSLAQDLVSKDGAPGEQFFAEAFSSAYEEQTEKMLGQYESKAGKIMQRVEREKANLEREVENMKDLQASVEKDWVFQLQSFPTKGVVKQSALVSAILLANQAAYQALLIVERRGGEPVTAALELALVAAALYFYGLRL
ncbi:hypothetical protein JKP88DRAFT_349945 [Tribonema minus]|uniref:Uncharacterized protein n=1 Tax=Tribonema minus TaxID=303371 RepID=A0A835YTP5_9STRA|nr:hypothetical protein JKP88DRAFT_349945 [Tribonema minus]